MIFFVQPAETAEDSSSGISGSRMILRAGRTSSGRAGPAMTSPAACAPEPAPQAPPPSRREGAHNACPRPRSVTRLTGGSAFTASCCLSGGVRETISPATLWSSTGSGSSGGVIARLCGTSVGAGITMAGSALWGSNGCGTPSPRGARPVGVARAAGVTSWALLAPPEGKVAPRRSGGREARPRRERRSRPEADSLLRRLVRRDGRRRRPSCVVSAAATGRGRRAARRQPQLRRLRRRHWAQASAGAGQPQRCVVSAAATGAALAPSAINRSVKLIATLDDGGLAARFLGRVGGRSRAPRRNGSDLRRSPEQLAARHGRRRAKRSGGLGDPALDVGARGAHGVGPRAHVADDLLAVELADDGQRVEIGQPAIVDDVDERPLAVEEAQDAVDLVGDLGEPLGEQVVVDLEDRVERGQLGEEPPPLVEAAQRLHEQSPRLLRDGVPAPDALPLDLEPPLPPREQPADGVEAREGRRPRRRRPCPRESKSRRARRRRP